MSFFWYLDNIPLVQQWLLNTNSNILTWIGLVKTVVAYGLMLIPEAVKEKVIAYLENLLQKCPHKLTQHIEEYDGRAPNQLFVAAEDYLRTKVTPSLSRLHVAKLPRVNKFLVSAGTNQAVTDIFEEVEFTWTLICNKEENSRCEKKWYELSFEKQYDSIVLDSYLPYVMQRAKVIQEENRTVRLYSLDIRIDDDDGYGSWGSIKFEHPSTFDTIAIDPEVRKELLQDFDKFLNRRDYYRGVGKAWKRGYLLYGPPGTGKTTLIAAMANYLNFNIYDLELANVQNSDFRNLLISTTNRSILVIEDIDCTVDLKDREEDSYSSDYSSYDDDKNDDLTLSGLLNFIDGLWSSVGDERIIVFTTNHKDKLDPALLRPGRMDMHIHMSYITPHGFRTLVNNYLQINEHFLFEEINVLIQEVNVTAAEVAEELMKTEDAEIALRSVIDFIKTKKTKLEEKNNNVEKKDDHGSKQEKGKNKRKNNNRKKGLLNFIDGQWSNVSDERIIVFTTITKRRSTLHCRDLDIIPYGFRILVNNYSQIKEHFLLEEIDVLIQEVNVTAAKVADELMKIEDVEIALRSVINSSKTEKTKLEETNDKVEKKDDQGSKQEKIKNKRKNIRNNKK